MTSKEMKVANYNKLSKPLCANPFLPPAPPPRQVEDRDNQPTTIHGKGSISFIMPIAAAEKANRASKQPYQHLRRIQRRSRKLQSRKMARAMASGAITTRAPRRTMMKATGPTEEWTPPTSEPISKAFKAAEEKMNEEIMTESWQVTCGLNEQEDDDDDALAEEEANLERVSNLSDVMESTIKDGILNHQQRMTPQQLQVAENMETRSYLPDANLPRYSKRRQATGHQRARYDCWITICEAPRQRYI